MKKLTILTGERSRLHTTAITHLWNHVLEGSTDDRAALIALDRRLTPRPPRLVIHHGPRDPPDRKS